MKNVKKLMFWKKKKKDKLQLKEVIKLSNGLFKYQIKDKRIIYTFIVTEKKKFSFMKPQAYILYEYIPGKWKILNIHNYKDIIKEKNDAHILHQIEGTLDGLPFFVVKKNIPISLNASTKSNITDKAGNLYTQGYDLCYNANVLYTLLQYVNFKNLSMQTSTDYGSWLKNNIKVIIIVLLVIGALLFLGLTDIGRAMIKDLFKGYYGTG